MSTVIQHYDIPRSSSPGKSGANQEIDNGRNAAITVNLFRLSVSIQFAIAAILSPSYWNAILWK